MKENEGPGRPREKEGGRRGARKECLKGGAVSAPERRVLRGVLRGVFRGVLRGVLRGGVSAPEILRRVQIYIEY